MGSGAFDIVWPTASREPKVSAFTTRSRVAKLPISSFPILLILLLLIYHSFSDLPSIIDLKDPQLTASVVYANDGETEMRRLLRQSNLMKLIY